MIGTPVNSNAEVAAQNESVFQAKASERRKMIDAKAREDFAKIDLAALSWGERFVQEYVHKCSARYWHVPDFDCSFLWKGLVPDRIFDKFFGEILPSVDVRVGLEDVQTPIFLAAGMSDYDCWPLAWQDLPNLPANMHIAIFDESGHWPQFEEPDFFDELVGGWAEKL
jgi:proline iminopeptidase